MNAVPIFEIPEHRQPPLANEQNFGNGIDSETESSLDEGDARAPSPSIQSSEPEINQELDLRQHNRGDPSDEEDEINESHLEHLRVSQQFLRAISMASSMHLLSMSYETRKKTLQMNSRILTFGSHSTYLLIANMPHKKPTNLSVNLSNVDSLRQTRFHIIPSTIW
jgi:hypothetical protein